jgi:hypothetical protein
VTKTNAINDGLRAFYEQSARVAADHMADLPAFDDLTAEQIHLWLLAFAAAVEVSARVSKALLSVGLAAGTEEG